jgi:hypothetical protein
MNQINPTYTVPTHFIKILFILLLLHLIPDLTGGYFTSCSPTKSYVYHSATCLTNLILLGFTTQRGQHHRLPLFETQN